MNAHETRHPDWIKVEPGNNVIREGDHYRVERSGGSAYEFDAAYDWEQKDFIPDATYFIWPRPEPKPYEAIPEGRENAIVMAVSAQDNSPVVGTYFLDRDWVSRVLLSGSGEPVCTRDAVTSAVPVTVVPTEALDELRTIRDKLLNDEEADVLAYHVVRQVDLFLTEIDGADA